MTDTIEPVMFDENEKQALAQRLVDEAKAEGIDLIGPDGLLSEYCLELSFSQKNNGKEPGRIRFSGTALPGLPDSTDGSKLETEGRPRRRSKPRQSDQYRELRPSSQFPHKDRC